MIIFQISVNIKQINEFVRKIKIENFYPTLSKKLEKIYISILTHNNMFKIINENLIKTDQRKKNKVAREQKYYNKTRIINLEIIKKKKEIWIVKQFEKEFT